MNDVMSLLGFSQRRPLRRLLFIVSAFVVVALFLKISFFNGEPGYIPAEAPHVAEEPANILADVAPKTRAQKSLVVSTMKGDSTAWIEEDLADWNVVRYVVDDADAQFTVPRNKGREAMVYLTYLIDHYYELPDLSVFIHNGRYQWHNDDPIYDGVQVLRNLQIPYLLSSGYTNLRCVWTLGCPNELKDLDKPKTLSTDEKSAKSTEFSYSEAFHQLFPGAVVPPTVGVACCAQFAVTREKVHERPIADYTRYRKWLLETPLPDSVSGRILEYTWHIIFGKSAVHCPDPKLCYCNLFGVCNLECTQNKCGERWAYPPYATLPNGWPEIGWKGEVRDQETLAKMRFVGMANSTL